jgi:hypothetical protein
MEMKFLGKNNGTETVYQVGPFKTDVEMIPVYVVVQLKAYGLGTYVNDNLPAMGLREMGISLGRQGENEWVVKLNFYEGKELTEEEMKQIEEAISDIQ